MKRFNIIFKAIAVFILTNLTTANIYCHNLSNDNKSDSIEISLLTCSPGNEIWAQYGHTAIRIEDKAKYIDVVINYGMFSSRQPYFIPRFVLGLTDYKVAAEPFYDFYQEYSYENRSVIQQKLDITYADKQAIIQAVRSNLLPQNQTYRYNFFYDNCTSRARDILIDNLHGKVKYPAALTENSSFRSLIHKWNDSFPWTQTGEDILLGVTADRKTTKEEQQFLPNNLKDDFAKATYDGHPLVKETTPIIEAVNVTEESSLPSPILCGVIFAILTIIICIIEKRKKISLWGWDLFLMISSGLIGTILTIMIFSEHPCVSLNLLILAFNPLPLLCAWSVTKHTIQKKKHWFWLCWEILIILSIIGAFIQSEPPLMVILALCLLCRTHIHLNIQKKYDE